MIRLLKSYLLAFLVLAIALSARAQDLGGTVTIKGSVMSEAGDPLPGVSVVVKQHNGSSRMNTTTDEKGIFRLQGMKPGAMYDFTFSFIGYENSLLNSFQVKDGSSNLLLIRMKEASKGLNELVVVGYGTRTKKELTGSVSSVRSSDLKQEAITSFDQALAGKMAGIQVMQTNGAPGGNVSIRVRGVGSISAGNNPLFVIDGVPITNDTRSASPGVNNYQQPFNPLASINVNDIASIDVLKDAASAAIYGSRGSNDVVLIRTKRGIAGKMTVSYDGSYGIQNVNKHVDVLDAYDYAKLVYEGHNNAYLDAVPSGKPTDPNSVRPQNPSTRIPPQILPYLEGKPGLTNTDWQKEIFRQAPMQSHTVSVSGGSESLSYYFSANYFNQDGIVINNNYKRYSSRFRVDGGTGKFRFGVNMTPSYTDNRVVNAEGPWFAPNSGVIALALGYAPIFPVRNPDGTFADSVNVWGYGQTNQLNPVAVATLIKDRIKNFRLTANAYMEYEFLPNLKYRISAGTDLNSFRRDYYRPSSLPLPSGTLPSVATGFSNTDMYTNWLTEHTVTYNKSFGKHKLDVLAGFTVQKENQEHNSLTANNFPTDIVTTLNAGQVNAGSSTLEQWSLNSWLGRAQYSYSDKYFLTASIRRDGSSRFGINQKWASFPAVSGAWQVSNEPFFRNIKPVSSLKIRSSYGLTGNFQIPNYGSLAQMSNTNSNYIFGNQALVNGVSITSPANPNLTWESMASFDAGLEFGLFNEQLNVTVDYYNAKTTKLLLNLPVPGASGFSTYLQNIGAVNNKGWEISLSYNKKIAKDWSIEGNANIAFNTNKVTKLGPSGAPIIATGGTGNTYFITKIGETIGSYYLYVADGIYRDQRDLDNSPKTSNPTHIGDLKFKDINGDGKIDANDRAIVGSFQPKYIFGFSNTVRYKNLDLSFSIQGSQGNKILNLFRRYIANVEGNFNNLSEVKDHYVSPENPGNGIVNRANRLATGGNGITSSWHVEDGSYIRVRNIALGYNLPASLLRGSHIPSARIYGAVQNPFTFSKYSLFNPEISNRTENALTAGEDYGSYPLARTYMIGLNVTF
ncbi:SusC/RagA family TonB-linked outer membrane protein [Chitinophaga sp. Ak27]|uniref:SusC/RagA family TonB-linked outer membrane protein n=1 Tax=Chitinophaga sp. Ak27 TaxID=2726116 RepID=UPI00145E0365|nr:TonB-dependent receptor [Chitinophaga sp. Ak27]NLU90666.1 TonB-dependent receptor [Chitinophaga sp. Ak27]